MEKVLFFFILFFLCWEGNSQELIEYNKYDAYDALNSIRLKAYIYDVDFDILFERHVDTILMWEPHQFPQPKRKDLSAVFASAKFLKLRKGRLYWKIHLSTELLSDYKLLERVLAHELGHTFGLKHCCDAKGSQCNNYICLEIMAVGHISDEKAHPFFYNAQWEEIYWENFFQLLKPNK